MKIVTSNNLITLNHQYQSFNTNRTFRLLVVLLLFLSCVHFEVCGSNHQNIKSLKDESPVVLHSQPSPKNGNSDRRRFNSKSTINLNRDRRSPLADPVAEVLGSTSNSGSNFRIAQDQVQNRHKPKFEKCKEYEPRVKEESARGKSGVSN